MQLLLVLSLSKRNAFGFLYVARRVFPFTLSPPFFLVFPSLPPVASSWLVSPLLLGNVHLDRISNETASATHTCTATRKTSRCPREVTREEYESLIRAPRGNVRGPVRREPTRTSSSRWDVAVEHRFSLAPKTWLGIYRILEYSLNPLPPLPKELEFALSPPTKHHTRRGVSRGIRTVPTRGEGVITSLLQYTTRHTQLIFALLFAVFFLSIFS